MADCICIIKSKPQLGKLLHLVHSLCFRPNLEHLFSFSENKDLQLYPIVMLPKMVHMQLAIPGCDDFLVILMIICSISRLLAVKRLQTNCQVVDVSVHWKLVHAQKFAHCGSTVNPVLRSRPCRTISQLSILFCQHVKGTLHPCGAIVFSKFYNHARYRSICLASICLCSMDIRVGIRHGNWKGKELIANISVFFTAIV